MSRDDPHFRLRFPDALRQRVEKAALENKRSMTAEILARLEWSFDAYQVRDGDGDTRRPITAADYESILERIVTDAGQKLRDLGAEVDDLRKQVDKISGKREGSTREN